MTFYLSPLDLLFEFFGNDVVQEVPEVVAVGDNTEHASIERVQHMSGGRQFAFLSPGRHGAVFRRR